MAFKGDLEVTVQWSSAALLDQLSVVSAFSSDSDGNHDLSEEVAIEMRGEKTSTTGDLHQYIR